MSLSRRTFLGTACSAAAWPVMTPVVMADAPGDNRLVVIVLRGAMDGLALAAPHDDPDLAQMRPLLSQRPMNDLDGRFGLGAPFAGLMPLWQAGDLGIVHTVSTPYRDKRSHFDGQDMLELGGAQPDGDSGGLRDGWLNRALAQIPGTRTETAMAIGRGNMLLLAGDAPAASWSTASTLTLGETSQALLARMYQGDPLFAAAFSEANMLGAESGERTRETGTSLAAYAAKRLRGPTRIAAFSLSGWDTHHQQTNALRRHGKQLSDALITLKRDLGPVWQKTCVLCITEFGRTVRENGSKGTDHGTGGSMILAGGAIKGGRMFGRWPGVREADLYQGRDLMPTDDVRRWAAWGLRGLFGLSTSAIETSVFPQLYLGGDPGFLA